MRALAAAGLFLLPLCGHAVPYEFVFFDGFETSTRPVTGAVIFTEIMSNPTVVSDASGEWFELTSVNPRTVDLGGCTVAQGIGSSILPAHALDSGVAAVAARNTDFGSNGGVDAFAAFSFPLPASGSLELSCDGRSIDVVSWTTETAGRSRSLDSGHYDAAVNDVDANWCLSAQSYNGTDTGTPNQVNEPCPPP